MKRKVFVYGSLKNGFHNHHWLKDSKFIEKAVLDNFCLISLGQFPCIISRTGCKVYGEVYEVSKAIERQLDLLEGVNRGMYSKIDIHVTLESGKEIEVFIYYIDHSNVAFKKYIEDKNRIIKSGIW